MQLATAMNLRKAMDEETKRERFASWYSTLPGIPAHEKEIIERSLKYNVWKELIKLFVVYMILSLVWFFGAGRYDPFESVTGYSLIGKKSVIGVVQEDGESLRLKNPNKGEHVSYTLAELGMDPIKYSYGSRFQTYWEKEKNGEYQLLAVLPEKQVSKIEGLYYGVMESDILQFLLAGFVRFLSGENDIQDGFYRSITGWKSFTQNMVYGRNTVLKEVMTWSMRLLLTEMKIRYIL